MYLIKRLVTCALIIFCASSFALEMNFAEVKKAAEQGDVNAQNTLAGMYASGKDVKVDFKEAVKWWT